jgi:adenosylmethionine-8-amino-7-oxononanoate aminotransferase
MLALRGAYHGDTLGAMAVCDPVGGMHARFEGVLSKNVFAERPPDGFDEPLAPSWEAHVRTLIAAHAHELAAIIAEPIVQGAGGMRFHSPACLALLRAVCDEHGLLLVADEIATGFGRTGAMFACEHAAVTPDVMCVGKALTGGTMSLAATICTGEVAEEIGRDGPLMHGPTFMGNPLACAAALASLELLADPRRREDVARIEGGLRAGLERAREVQGVRDVRVLGAIGVVELAQAVDVAQATRAAVDRGVWLRPFRELIYAMPAYVMGDEDVATVADAIVAAAQSQSRQGSAEPARAS